MADRIVVFGAGGHAKVVIEAILARTPDREIVILDDAAENDAPPIFGIAVSGGRDRLDSLRGTPVVPAIGRNDARERLMQWLQEQGQLIETVLHPRAFVADSVKIGAGAFVSAAAIIIASAQIGAGAIINTAASVDHDCIIGQSAHIAPGVHLCGNVRIGARALVGVGTSICPGVSVCDDVVVGAGSVVIRDIAEAGTDAGNPVRRLR
jgi:sugar O-acyltransferase (sialic acid O-acetyltransferase NeuD family)